MHKGIVVSDLHLFASRSAGESNFAELSAHLREVDVLVLNGDIFDFRWANFPHSVSIPKALDWLKNLKDDFPEVTLHFIPGNHDCLPAFVSEVDDMPGIELHEHHLLLGKNLFLHGDAATARMDHAGFRKFRSGWEIDSPRGRLSAGLYHAADHLRLTDLTHGLWFGGMRAIRRLIWHLDQVRPGWKDEVEECFFGHTHLPLSGIEEEGVRFHNTGSGIRGASFVPIRFHYRSHQTLSIE